MSQEKTKLKKYYCTSDLAFKLLSGAVGATNSSKENKRTKKGDGIFEPVKQTENKGKTDDFSSYRPILLPGLDLNQQPFR